MARQPAQLSLEEERTTRKREALARLDALRRDLQLRIGSSPGDPIVEARRTREQQRDEVVRLARAR
jgi:hypothetical protein